MKVSVKLYATLRRFAPSASQIGEAFSVELDDASLRALLGHLGIEEGQAKIIMINGNRETNLDAELNEQDLVVIFPPVGGG
jgi:molybdopterin converting factor small subunit